MLRIELFLFFFFLNDNNFNLNHLKNVEGQKGKILFSICPIISLLQYNLFNLNHLKICRRSKRKNPICPVISYFPIISLLQFQKTFRPFSLDEEKTKGNFVGNVYSRKETLQGNVYTPLYKFLSFLLKILKFHTCPFILFYFIFIIFKLIISK